ncbi:MAG: HAD hydrolase-like protein [Fibrobacter sp.]|nr:HAD hydrolase-like protein [Fibrobacter sp.]
MEKSKPVRAVVFDLDGTLYLSGKPYPGAVETVKKVAEQVPVFYLSNNTSKSPVFYENHLRRMGFPLSGDGLLSALTNALAMIHEQKIGNVFLFANAEVSEWFAAQDPSLNLNPDMNETELVLMAYHNAFTYRELCELSWRLQRGARFWVTHTDFVCPDVLGPVPDIGSFLAMLETAYHIRPELYFGKPNPEMLSPVLAKFAPEEILLVGDRLYTDFELSRRAGSRFALTLCGETKQDDLIHLSEKPEIVADLVRDIPFEELLTSTGR